MKLTAERKTGAVAAEVDLDGGRLSALVIDGLSLLVDPDGSSIGSGSFPMIPWCGRLSRGRLRWNETTYKFPITARPHAIHGLLHMSDWTQIDDQTIRADLDDPWPFGGFATQHFDLSANSLTITAELHAVDQPMPAMIGWHPWFKRRLERGGDATLSVLAESAYELDTHMVPTGELMAVPPHPWDHCFVDMVLPPVVDWPNALSLSITSTFDHWVIYTAPEHAFCVEPQSGPPNQLNSDPTIVVPGEPLTGSMTLDWG